MAEAMVGRQLVEIKNSGTKSQEEVLLKIEGLSVKKKGITKAMTLDNFSVNVHAGEIVAICTCVFRPIYSGNHQV